MSHILVADEAKANEVKGSWPRARTSPPWPTAESIDTESKATGGDLGCDITPDTSFVPEFLRPCSPSRWARSAPR